MLDRNDVPLGPPLKPLQKRCKPSGRQCPVLGIETLPNAIQAACLPPAPRF